MENSVPPRKRHTGCLIVSLVLLASILMGVGLFIRQVHRYYVGIKTGEINPVLERKLFSTGSGKMTNQKVTSEDLQHLHRVGVPEFGTSTAKLTIVEFVDFDCPYCRALAPTMKTMIDRYKNEVRFVFRQFPIMELHPNAVAASIAALCAHEQNKFLEYHDQLFANQEQRTEADYYRFATIVGLDQAKFDTCLKDTQRYQTDIETDIQDGLRVGVQGTPTIFFNDTRIQGAPDGEVMDFLIKRFLKEAK